MWLDKTGKESSNKEASTQQWEQRQLMMIRIKDAFEIFNKKKTTFLFAYNKRYSFFSASRPR